MKFAVTTRALLTRFGLMFLLFGLTLGLAPAQTKQKANDKKKNHVSVTRIKDGKRSTLSKSFKGQMPKKDERALNRFIREADRIVSIRVEKNSDDFYLNLEDVGDKLELDVFVSGMQPLAEIAWDDFAFNFEMTGETLAGVARQLERKYADPERMKAIAEKMERKLGKLEIKSEQLAPRMENRLNRRFLFEAPDQEDDTDIVYFDGRRYSAQRPDGSFPPKGGALYYGKAMVLPWAKADFEAFPTEQDTPESPDFGATLQELTTYPNPSEGRFRLGFVLTTPGDLSVSVTDKDGKAVFNDEKPSFQGTYNEVIDLREAPAGEYLLKIVQDGRIHRRRIKVNP